MGTFRVRIEVGGEEQGRFEPVEVLADTGATYTVLPRALLEALGVVPHARAPFVVADGREIELEIGWATIRIDGHEERSLVVFGDAALLGAFHPRGAPARARSGGPKARAGSCVAHAHGRLTVCP